ncbi:MAG: hypothetical protein HOE44_06800 [Candidatus Marinimicrobia bacterium]|jgi:hypothetical protein|nr:hypothetical protein [Candidatus Neomarinimicrobiota bacterium]
MASLYSGEMASRPCDGATGAQLETFVRLLIVIWIARYIAAATIVLAVIWIHQFLNRNF